MVDKEKLIRELLYIDDKQGNVCPFTLNSVQSHFMKNKTGRNIVLKARQLGVSSAILADMYTDCITIPHTTCAVISHETRATQRLLDRVQFYYDAMDEPKPEQGAESRSEKSFPALHSSIYVGTAGSRAFGRGDTIRKALLSELSFYEDGEKVLTGVEDAVPVTGELTIECTPNGEDNIFYEKWTKAREGKSSYKPFFFPWWFGGEYQLPQNHPLALQEDKGELVYTGEEIDLVERFGLSEEQVRWRRYKIGEKGGLFFQEYPEDEVSCFISIGDPVFDPYILTQLAQGCYEGNRHPQGWTYWIPPVEGEEYLIAVDSAAGVPGGSYSAALVLDENWQVCATFQARLDPIAFAGILNKMGKWYNLAELVVERNFTGYAVLGHLTEYPNVYMQRDFVTGKTTTQRGWWTNEQTKELMRTSLRDKLPLLKIWDVNLIRQARGYRYIKFKPTAQTFDDLVIALMIGCAVKNVTGGARGYVGAALTWDW